MVAYFRRSFIVIAAVVVVVVVVVVIAVRGFGSHCSCFWCCGRDGVTRWRFDGGCTRKVIIAGLCTGQDPNPRAVSGSFRTLTGRVGSCRVRRFHIPTDRVRSP